MQLLLLYEDYNGKPTAKTTVEIFSKHPDREERKMQKIIIIFFAKKPLKRNHFSVKAHGTQRCYFVFAQKYIRNIDYKCTDVSELYSLHFLQLLSHRCEDAAIQLWFWSHSVDNLNVDLYLSVCSLKNQVPFIRRGRKYFYKLFYAWVVEYGKLVHYDVLKW